MAIKKNPPEKIGTESAVFVKEKNRKKKLSQRRNPDVSGKKKKTVNDYSFPYFHRFGLYHFGGY